jgi:hypothetical protein
MTYIAEGHDPGARHSERLAHELSGDIQWFFGLKGVTATLAFGFTPLNAKPIDQGEFQCPSSANSLSPRRIHAFGRSPSVTRQSVWSYGEVQCLI